MSILNENSCKVIYMNTAEPELAFPAFVICVQADPVPYWSSDLLTVRSEYIALYTKVCGSNETSNV